MNLVEFLNARLDEQEARHPANWWQECDRCREPVPCWYERDAESKRAIAREHGPSHKHTTLWDWPELGRWCGECGTEPCRELNSCSVCGGSDGCTTLRLLALPFASHPEYQETWKP